MQIGAYLSDWQRGLALAFRAAGDTCSAAGNQVSPEGRWDIAPAFADHQPKGKESRYVIGLPAGVHRPALKTLPALPSP